MISLRLKPVLEQRLGALAQRTGRSKTFYVARAIEDCLPEFEQIYEPLPSL
jgi:RHH-type transcriptional regulator, rel operon repressor / antitoxin RelB